MLCNKGKSGLHLQRSCSCQNKEIYGIFVSGRIFRCISRINRVRCFQNNVWSARRKGWGSHQWGISQGDGGWCRGSCHLSSQDKTCYQLKSHKSQWCPWCQQPHGSPTAGAGQVDRGSSLETKPHLPDLGDRQMCSDKHINTHTLHTSQYVLAKQ